MRARVSVAHRVIEDLPNLPRYRLVILDESHNLRNRESKRYKVIQEYLQKERKPGDPAISDSYNKTYLDLSNQLRLFVPEAQELGLA